MTKAFRMFPSVRTVLSPACRLCGVAEVKKICGSRRPRRHRPRLRSRILLARSPVQLVNQPLNQLHIAGIVANYQRAPWRVGENVLHAGNSPQNRQQCLRRRDIGWFSCAMIQSRNTINSGLSLVVSAATSQKPADTITVRAHFLPPAPAAPECRAGLDESSPDLPAAYPIQACGKIRATPSITTSQPES